MKERNGIKSAYELAMERLNRNGGAQPGLSSGQKSAIHAADRQAQARVAEIEIMMDRQIAEARAAGDETLLQSLQAQRADDIRKARARCEDEKERIRRGEAQA